MKKYLFTIAAGLLGCACVVTAARAAKVQQGISEKVLRFHVLANSDSDEDQALKIKVRDGIGVYLSEEMDGVDSRAESEEFVAGHLTEIAGVAAGIVRGEGYDYAVSASLENCDFPEKTYGDYTFPAGEYEALRVVIGEGKGHNWWCVLYPNLCFSGSVCEVDPESGEKLQAQLTDAEYAALLKSGDCRAQFKILKFLNRALE